MITTLYPAITECFLAGSVLILLMIGVFAGHSKFNLIMTISMAILGAGIIIMYTQYLGPVVTFNDMFIADEFSLSAKALIMGGGIIALLLSIPYFKQMGGARVEYPILILLATTGMMIMVSAMSFLTLYVGLELQSLSLYVLTSIRRDDGLASEAGLKYFVLGALSSGILLYGISMVYGFAGTIDYGALTTLFADNTQIISPGLVVGLVFVICGLTFKISAVPFHMWTPDVYQGAPTPITAYLSMAPKVAAFAVLIRLFMGAFVDVIDQWQQVVVALSVASMTVGALAAIVQTNIKRLLAYSSIGHMGYALIGLSAGTMAGIESILLYLTIYMIMSAGVFAILLSMRDNKTYYTDINDFAGLSQTYPSKALGMTILMLSMAGIPPLGGFLAKLYVFKAAVNANLILLAIYGVITSVIGAYYYLRLIKIMYVDEPVHVRDDQSMAWELKYVALGASLIMVGMIIMPSGFIEFAARIGQSLNGL